MPSCEQPSYVPIGTSAFRLLKAMHVLVMTDAHDAYGIYDMEINLINDETGGQIESLFSSYDRHQPAPTDRSCTAALSWQSKSPPARHPNPASL